MTTPADGQRFDIEEHVPYTMRPAPPRNPPPKDPEEESSFSDDAWSTGWRALCACINTCSHMMSAIVVFQLWTFAYNYDYTGSGALTKLNWHMILNGTGYHLLMAEGILSMSGNNVWSFVMAKDTRAVVHAFCQILGGLFVITGSSLIIAYKGSHFETAHGICGLIALIFAITNLVTGILALFSSKVKLGLRAPPIKLVHTVVGLATFVMGNVALCLGFDKSFFMTEAGEGVGITLIIFTSLIMTYVVISPIQSIFRLYKETTESWQ